MKRLVENEKIRYVLEPQNDEDFEVCLEDIQDMAIDKVATVFHFKIDTFTDQGVQVKIEDWMTILQDFIPLNRGGQ